MGWPYKLLSLSPEERTLRRHVLDRYGGYAQLLVLVPVVVALAFRAVTWASRTAKARYGSYDAIPDSPSLKSQRQSAKGTWATRARQLSWWLGDDVSLFGRFWGRRDEWVFGGLWTLLLLTLCVLETDRDYLHLTKRFGIIAASQFPVQYLLGLKFLNPFAFVFRSSHEQVNRWHRVLGRIIYGLLCLHGALYLNYFVQVGILKHRLSAPVVVAGIISFLGLTLMNTTALAAVRNYSYRIFFLTHVMMAFVLPAVLFFHAKPANVYMAEALLVFIADLTMRKIFTISSDATMESIPGTDLIKISTTIPYSRASRFREHPGSHIYLNLPGPSRPSSSPTSIAPLVFEFLFNPFTVAAVDEENGSLTIVARRRNGPLTSALARLARSHSAAPVDSESRGPQEVEKVKIPLSIEGPYGSAAHFPNLAGSDFDRVLLVAGGVGATFAVPIYRSIVHDNPNLKVDLVWAVRDAGDATWAVTEHGSSKNILNDNNVHIYLTGDILDSDAASSSAAAAATAAAATARSERSGSSRAVEVDGDGEVEMSTMYRDRQRNRYTTQHNRKRPDLKKIVDNAFRHGNEDRVAVLVCGPGAMAREVREHVGVWIMRGRSVFFHSESFDW